MISRLRNSTRRVLTRLAGSDGAEIVEFVVSLPLIMVTVVGIFDFGSAFIVRQKLSNAALEGARVGSNQPNSDLTTIGAPPCSAPASICALRDVIDTTLTESRLNDCGLGSAAATAGPGALMWTFTANTACPGTLTLTIERGCVLGSATCTPTTSPTVTTPPFQTTPYWIEATRVTLSYPYKWEFNKVIGLLVPGASYAAVSQITSVGIMQNLN